MRYLTAGESHGKGLVAIVEGFPSNLKLDIDKINAQLARRQQGYGRGGRMNIETDKVDIYSGVRNSITLGSPIAVIIENKDYKNWAAIMDSQTSDTTKKVVTCVRPGHADLVGCIKYNHKDARNVLERASARETAARVAVGAMARQFLENIGVFVGSHVTEICGVRSSFFSADAYELIEKSDANSMRCLDENAAEEMKKVVDTAIANGDTVGGEIELIVSGMPVGIGSYVHFDRKLDARLSSHLMGIQAVKSLQFGDGVAFSRDFGSQLMDEMSIRKGIISRKSNHAGGVEGGMSTGENIKIKLTIKPIPTLMKGINSVDISSKENSVSAKERSDYCAVPAAGVVAENVLCYALAECIMDCVGGDDMTEIKTRVNTLRERKL